MTGSPPLKLFVDPDAKPVAAHKPAQVPMHWKEAVKGGLDRDVRLGVLEKVDVNVPVERCSRMVVTPKPNSDEHRRVIDYQPPCSPPDTPYPEPMVAGLLRPSKQGEVHRGLLARLS